MKCKILLAIAGLLFCVNGYGFDTCMHGNSYLLILRPEVDGTSSRFDPATKEWEVVFNYITLTGFAACNEISGTANTPTTNLVTNALDEGPNCWCQMWPVENYDHETGPSSYWMYLDAGYTTAAQCSDSTTGCAKACADAVREDDTFRTAMFESMW